MTCKLLKTWIILEFLLLDTLFELYETCGLFTHESFMIYYSWVMRDNLMKYKVTMPCIVCGGKLLFGAPFNKCFGMKQNVLQIFCILFARLMIYPNSFRRFWCILFILCIPLSELFQIPKLKAIIRGRRKNLLIALLALSWRIISMISNPRTTWQVNVTGCASPSCIAIPMRGVGILASTFWAGNTSGMLLERVSFPLALCVRWKIELINLFGDIRSKSSFVSKAHFL